ncbi:hypothetical protein NNA36_01210 [Shimia sp. CNT1-13L.2]|nr:hypothetical protein [Shimia sp. CNT1-13L.2]MCP9480569.1 hypothetical protein [Shimia sp. CNT1-13L.2]
MTLFIQKTAKRILVPGPSDFRSAQQMPVEEFRTMPLAARGEARRETNG